MVTNRMQKFDELILREVSTELRNLFPETIFSVTQVHVSKDLSFAKVWISVIGDAEGFIKEAKKHASDIRNKLAKKVVARRVPALYLVADKTVERALKITELIDKAKKHDVD